MSVEQIEAARTIVDVATVQNRYNLVDRSSDAELRYCTEHGIAFIPWAPADAGALAQEGNAAHDAAVELGATAAQVALAWLLQRSSVMVPIPGTASLEHLEENCGAARAGAPARRGGPARLRGLLTDPDRTTGPSVTSRR